MKKKKTFKEFIKPTEGKIALLILLLLIWYIITWVLFVVICVKYIVAAAIINEGGEVPELPPMPASCMAFKGLFYGSFDFWYIVIIALYLISSIIIHYRRKT